MKKLLLLMLAAWVIPSWGWSQSVWHKVSSPVNENLVSVCFVDMDHGWILSEEGTLISTDNAGQSWQTTSLAAGTYTSLYFTDTETGYITGYQDSSLILLTSDGGANWQLSDHLKAYRLNDVYFHDAEHGWVAGIKDNMNYNLYTEDGGQNWVPQMDIFVMEAELFSVHFRDGQIGNTCGLAGAFFTTNSAGMNGWSLDVSIPSLGVDLYSIHNWGVLEGCAVGSSGTALHTKNKWATYNETLTNIDKTLYAVTADPVTNKIWAAGEDGTIIFTPNPLLGWAVQTTNNIDNLMDIDMIDDAYGWAVGDNGAIWRYGPDTGMEESAVGSQQLAVSVFPNPTGGIFDLRFTVYNLQSVSCSIYDMHGREVAVVLDEMLPEGEHVVRYDMSGLPVGVYLCKLAVGSKQLAVGKVVKIR